MNPRISGRSACLAVLLSTASVLPQISNATVVEFQTVMGTFEVNLYDNATPETVANFLNYVNNGRYSNSIIHRSVPDFVVQGGGFIYNNVLPLESVTTFDPVVNEPEFANVRGTIAMAKLGGDPNSATSQWFFNLADNTAGLDGQNGGFTVFGEVVGDGMDVIDAIAALDVFNFGGAVVTIPLRNYTAADFANNEPVGADQLVTISAIVVSDSTVDSAAGLNPPANTAGQVVTPPVANSGGGGGSIGLFGLFGLLLVRLRR
jgi:peptidyl-prolyl cis-trans isomerase A (cyclophilin A)